MSLSDVLPVRKIRSFVRREGRLTRSQEQALLQYGGRYCLDVNAPFRPDQDFGRTAPLIVEIGFGNGDSLLTMATEHPERSFLGIEVHRPGVGRLLQRLAETGTDNVRLYCHDAVEILQSKIPDRGLAAVHLFFPDPWPKKKHHKRRLVQKDFLDLLSRKLRPGGYFHTATDWQPYAEAMLTLLSAHAAFSNAAQACGYAERPAYRPLTKFERRGLRLGHGVWDLIFVRN